MGRRYPPTIGVVRERRHGSDTVSSVSYADLERNGVGLAVIDHPAVSLRCTL